MERAWSFGEREILAELEQEAREGAQGERCDWCNGSGIDGWNAQRDEPIDCPACQGTGEAGA